MNHLKRCPGVGHERVDWDALGVRRKSKNTMSYHKYKDTICIQLVRATDEIITCTNNNV